MLRNKFIICLVLVLSLLMPATPLHAAPLKKPAVYYTEVPGITKEEVEAIEKLKAQYPQGLIYGAMYSSESYKTDDGAVHGFARLMSEWLGKFFDMPVQVKLYEWDDLISGLHDNSIHLTSELTSTPERLKTYHMTTPVAERPLAVFQLASREAIDLINSSETLRFGFLADTTLYDQIKDLSPIEIIPVSVQNYDDAAKALRNKTIDAYIEESIVQIVFADMPDIVAMDYYPTSYSPVSLSTAVRDLAPFINVVQKHMDNGGTQLIDGFYEEGYREYLKDTFYSKLTAEEKEYIAQHVQNKVPIRVAAEFDNYPLSFYNNQEKQWQGIAFDLFGEVSRLTGLTFMVPHSPQEAWAPVLRRLETGDCAIITELLHTMERKNRFLWAEKPYNTDQYAFLSRSDHANITLNQIRHKKVGLVSGSGYEETFHKLLIGHENAVPYSDAITALEDLDTGKIDLMFAPSDLLLSLTHYMERPHFKVNLPVNIPCNSYFGFNKNEVLLCSIVDKAQSVIDYKTLANKWQYKIFDYNRKLEQARTPYLIGISILLLIILILSIVLYRKREKNFRSMGMLDHLTKLPNRRAYDNTIRREWEYAIKHRQSISLLTADIDYFKNYNDTYGHPQGDILLQELGEILRGTLMRSSDFAARLGGEEFAILLPNTDENGAVTVAESIRHKVEDAIVPIAASNEPTRVTISIGIACMIPKPGDQIETLIECSDKALYTAKDNGRNRVHVYSGTLATKR